MNYYNTYMKAIDRKLKFNNNSIRKDVRKEELPFSSEEIIDILRIVDVALAHENTEKEVQNWLGILHEPIETEKLEDLHKKVNIFLQKLNNIN